MRTADISLSGMAILAVCVDSLGKAGAGDLRECVPFPSEPSDWFAALQELLDAGLVVRVAAKDRYLYQATVTGVRSVRAFLHPAGNQMESLA